MTNVVKLFESAKPKPNRERPKNQDEYRYIAHYLILGEFRTALGYCQETDDLDLYQKLVALNEHRWKVINLAMDRGELHRTEDGIVWKRGE